MCRIKVLFQVLFYNVQKGKNKTPLHLMTGHSIHEKCKSRQLITLFNKASLSVNYNEIMKSHCNLAQYTTKECSESLAFPSHFAKSSFTMGLWTILTMKKQAFQACREPIILLWSYFKKLQTKFLVKQSCHQ